MVTSKQAARAAIDCICYADFGGAARAMYKVSHSNETCRKVYHRLRDLQQGRVKNPERTARLLIKRLQTELIETI